jgi:hypothetical protein
MRISGMRAPLRSLPVSIINLLGASRKAVSPRPLVVFDNFARSHPRLVALTASGVSGGRECKSFPRMSASLCYRTHSEHFNQFGWGRSPSFLCYHGLTFHGSCPTLCLYSRTFARTSYVPYASTDAVIKRNAQIGAKSNASQRASLAGFRVLLW